MGQGIDVSEYTPIDITSVTVQVLGHKAITLEIKAQITIAELRDAIEEMDGSELEEIGRVGPWILKA